MDISTITIPNPPPGTPALPLEGNAAIGKATPGKASGSRSTENSGAAGGASLEGQVDRNTDGDFGKLVQAARTKPLPQAGDPNPAARPGSPGPGGQGANDGSAAAEPATSALKSHKTARKSRRATGISSPASASLPAPVSPAPVSLAKVANSATGRDHKAVGKAKAEAVNAGGPKIDKTKAGTAARSVTGQTPPGISGAKPPPAARAGTRSTATADPDGQPVAAAGVAVVADGEQSGTPASAGKAPARHQAADPQGAAAATTAQPVAIPIMTMRPLGRSTGVEARRGDGQSLFAAGAAAGKVRGAGMRAAKGVIQSNAGSVAQSAGKSPGQSAAKSPGKSAAAQTATGLTGPIELSGPTSNGQLNGFMKAVTARPQSGNAIPNPAGAGDSLAKAGPPPAELSPAITPAHDAALSIKGIAQSHAAQATAPARGPALSPGPAQQVAVYISRAAREGGNRFSIRLHPAELGHVKVSMEVSRDGHVIAVLSAERPETLDLLQRDSRALERALQDSGLKTDSGSLNFSLQGQDKESHFAHRSSGFDGTLTGAGQSAPVDDIIMAMGSGAGRRALDISV